MKGGIERVIRQTFGDQVSLHDLTVDRLGR
jgi:hypothetical protein